MKKNQLFYILFAILGGIIFACSGENSDETAKKEFRDVEALPGEDTTAREQDEFDRDVVVYTKTNLKKLQQVQRKFKNVTHFSSTGAGLLFLRQSKKEAFINGRFDDKVRFSLIDEKGNELLPMTCQEIANPGFTVKDYVEYKEDGKYGLFNYAKNEKIEARYDLIYPSKIMEYVAIGERDGNLYKIYADGKEKKMADDENPPNYYNLLKEFRYNYSSKFFGIWYGTEDFQEYTEHPEYIYPAGMVMAPSFLSKLEVIPATIRSIMVKGDTTDMTAVKQVKRNENVTAMTTSYYDYFGESRGYSEKSLRLTTIGKKNKFKETVVLYAYDEYSEPHDQKNLPQAIFLNDSLIEVRNFVTREIEEEYFSLMPYWQYTKYEYYSIEADGDIVQLGQGFYPMISAIKLSRAHFKGEFAQSLSEFELIERGFTEEEVQGTGDLRTNHLSAADLEFMINELYAYKGMKFTDTELTNYFSQFSWYKPKYKNVDNKLTDIEKTNIRMIKNLIKDIKANPGKFITENASPYIEAG